VYIGVRRVYLEAYGCWLARAEALAILREMGASLVANPEEADEVLVYTCAVREDGEVRQLRALERIAKLGKPVTVAGCLAKARPRTITMVVRGARIVLPGPPRPTEYDPSVTGVTYVLPLQVGCLGDCTFCVTRYTRGGAGYVRSLPPDEAVEYVKRAVARGAREIYLTGQDVVTYGAEHGWRGEWSLPKLLERILSEVEGSYMVRIGMSEPAVFARFADQLIDIVKRDERVYKFFHLPVQSGSDRVLEAMRRKYTVAEYVELVKRIRREIPDSFIATDIIVGFPGETDEDFEASMRLVEELRFDKVHVARYSRRPFTEAAVMPNQVPDPVKKARSRALSELALRVAEERNREYVGRRVRALVTEVDHGVYVARAMDYRQVALPAPAPIGAVIEADIGGAGPVYLYAEGAKVVEPPPRQDYGKNALVRED